ncbi:hypothetical protein Pmani_024231 [Petrolisthes manimaculis]|uniref:Uncharacterized protein n=1 Tax=Petrolisthes manimaculis TaxID=1843537 RepID=A0AAE1PAL2_9EUCA|nr:hypothetical protein Pmani_024231 [Petrolisthes manimaculis]
MKQSHSLVPLVPLLPHCDKITPPLPTTHPTIHCPIHPLDTHPPTTPSRPTRYSPNITHPPTNHPNYRPTRYSPTNHPI